MLFLLARFDWQEVINQLLKIKYSRRNNLLNGLVLELLEHKIHEVHRFHLLVHNKQPEVTPNRCSGQRVRYLV